MKKLLTALAVAIALTGCAGNKPDIGNIVDTVADAVEMACGKLSDYAAAEIKTCELLPDYELVYKCRQALEITCEVAQIIQEREAMVDTESSPEEIEDFPVGESL